MLARTEKSSGNELIDEIVANIGAARRVEHPFLHLDFDRVFPEDVYAEMVELMPSSADYRAMPGHDNGNLRADGTSTRVKIDLFPEYIRHLPRAKRSIWSRVGKALTSEPVKAAIVNALAPGLERRFGEKFRGVGMYPIPVLTRDTPGYRIDPHTDSKWKGITVQFYLPRDASATHIGTIFHDPPSQQWFSDRGPLPNVKKMRFAPNTGYAFAVGRETWHSADPVGAEVDTRDSILLTYFVDASAVQRLRNRGKRVGNFLLNEVRNLTR